jgi:hypothetical protein
MAGGTNSGARMTFSYSAVWDDTLRLLRENGRLLAAIAGVFIFLPALLVAQFLPPPEVPDPARMWDVLGEYYRRAWPWYLLQSLFSIVGTAAMTKLVLARGTTVGAALVFGVTLLPFYIMLTIAATLLAVLACLPALLLIGVIGVAVGPGPAMVLISMLGLFAMLVPLLYLAGRLIPSLPVMVAEGVRNPIAVLTRSFALTKGKGWAVLGLFIVIVLVGAIVAGVATALVGILFHLVAGQEIGALLTALVSSLLSAAFATLLIMLYAAIYRALAPTSVATAFE